MRNVLSLRFLGGFQRHGCEVQGKDSSSLSTSCNGDLNAEGTWRADNAWSNADTWVQLADLLRKKYKIIIIKLISYKIAVKHIPCSTFTRS